MAEELVQLCVAGSLPRDQPCIFPDDDNREKNRFFCLVITGVETLEVFISLGE